MSNSNLDKMKEKTKLSVDEMYNNQLVGNTENQASGHPTIETEVHHNENKEVSPVTHSTIPPYEKMNCKITFNTCERLFDAFNEIYAKRIIEKRKTDKSALLNEALELLIKKEKGR